MNLVRLGLAVRALRRRHGWRQIDLARRAGVSQQAISRLERGRAQSTSFATADRVVGTVGADLDVVVRWRGGAVDRLLDERHAALSGVVSDRLATHGWNIHPEVSYAEYAERGSIDVLAIDEANRIVVVVEVKTELLSIEATLRKHDEKCRLAPRIVHGRFGMSGPWRTCGLLVLPDTGASRRRVAAHAAVLDRVYPLRGRELSGWLRDRSPREGGGGLLFLPLTHGGSSGRSTSSPHRVRVVATSRSCSRRAARRLMTDARRRASN